MRFKQLTLIGVISGLLLNALKSTPTSSQALITSYIGMIIASVIWVMEVRSSVHGIKAREEKASH